MTPADLLTASPSAPRFRRWVEASPLAAYACDPDGRVLAFNADARELWGAEPQGGEQERYCGPVRPVMADGRSQAPERDWLADVVRRHAPEAHGEMRLARADGTILTTEVHVRGLELLPGEAAWSGIALVDVTRRAQMETLHLEHTRLLESIASGAPLLACLENVAQALARLIPGAVAGVILANEARTQLTVVSSEALPASFVTRLNSLRGEALYAACGLDRLSRAPWSYADLADPQVAQTPWRELWLTHGLRATLTVPIILTDGPAIAATFVAFRAAHPFTACERQLAATGAHLAGTAIARDQMQRSMQQVQQQLEARLERSLQLHRLSLGLTDDCSDGAWQQRVVEAARELLDASAAALHLVEDDTGRAALVAAAGVAREQASGWPTEPAGPGPVTAARTATTQWREAVPLYDADERVVGQLTVYWPAERHLADHEEALFEVLARHVANLVRRCRAEASQHASQRAKDQFLAQLAHELRNPLAPIRNASLLLRRREGDWPEMAWCRDVIERQVAHLTRLVDDLLDVSRIGRNRLTLRRKPVRLEEVLHAAVEITRSQFEQKRQSLQVSLDARPAWLDADSVRLTQVFVNLLTNASKYTEPGGSIRLASQRLDGQVDVVVSDSGVGLSEGALARIFDLFYQVDRTLERSQGGLGIGLSLVKRLVELHGGTVSAASAGPGCGSAFTVRLPLSEPQPAPVARDEDTDVVSERESRRILVVDDYPEITDSLARVLRELGHDVWTAPDGARGVALAEQLQPDAVILDLGMPHMDGYEACRRIRSHEWGKSLLLVAVTARGDQEDRLRSIDSGFDFHLTKPASPEQIARLVKALTG